MMRLLQSIATAFFRRPNVIVRGVDRLPQTGPFIIAANHNGFIEPVVLALLVARRTGQRAQFLTKHVVYRKFRLFGLPRLLGMIDVMTKHKADSLESAVATLKRGGIIVFFPEGIRNPARELLKGKTGMIRAAVRSGAPILPVGYTGPKPRGRIASFVVFWKRTISVTIALGQPMTITHPETITDTWLHEQTTRVMQEIGPLCTKTYVH